MSLGRKVKAPFKGPNSQSLEGMSPEYRMASDIIDKTVGRTACIEARQSLAKRYNMRQLTKLMDFIKQL